MNRVTLIFTSLVVCVAACDEQSTPTGARPSFSAPAPAAPAACPTPATVTVTDEAGLRSAIATATPGTVIGIRGMIGLTEDDTIMTDGITITCATPGSGLFADSGGTATDMLTVGARKVSVDHLVLDASRALDGPYLSLNDGVAFLAESTRFTNNSASCPPDGVCVFIVGGVGDVVSDNVFQANGPFTGIQMQTGGDNGDIRIDGARVERNTLITTAPSTGPNQGAIRPVAAVNLVIADNTASGPWRSGVSATRVSDSRITGNTFQGSALYGIRTQFAAASVDVGIMRNNLFGNNRVAAAGVAGAFVKLACGNVFVGNNLQGNPGNVGLVFDATSGANTYAGDRTVVVDNGAFDCDGDGVNDPNIIAGPGAARHGLQLGSPVSSTVVRSVRGIVVQ